MKIIIIGGVAAGTKTAAKLKRERPMDDVVIYTKSKDISYAGCGLPYYVGGSIEAKEDLIVNTPAEFMGLTGVAVHTNSEVTAVDPDRKTVTVNGEEISYDKLVIAVGAEPAVPDVKGIHRNGVFTVRTPEDAIGIREYCKEKNTKKAVVVGGGFIGLEIAENLTAKGISVTVVDMAQQLLPGVFDPEMADFIRRKLQEKGIRVIVGAKLEEVTGETCVSGVRTSVSSIPAELVVVAAGIRAATEFLDSIGLEMHKGCIVTDEYQRTNLDDIYAVGDCAVVKNRITGKIQWSAMGSTANITGRALALNLNSEKTEYNGCLGTAVVKLTDTLKEMANRAGDRVILK